MAAEYVTRDGRKIEVETLPKAVWYRNGDVPTTILVVPLNG